MHLRAGDIARGGLRWSDRREDFRTEVLGLMKAQVVKNTVIVPTGAKGGFFCKRLPAVDREARQAGGIECYKTFIRGLLDVTDNVVDGAVVTPPGIVRRDGDDPYLVVAADKGTATFSDIANGIAAEYRFWLDDAFASGGSVGYDHKKMAITARGAWEAVKRHFREQGLNTQKDPITVVGIGDMSGDVFGNGMLLSRKIRLLAAFNHLHIFLDPDPDMATSYKERKRLFRKPRSGWDDYSESLISKGGGVYSRQSKTIKLSNEVRTMLGTDQSSMQPDELVRSILRMPVDLLWNGGIGTYVKASTESHSDVGDRSNDNLRVNANALRCKVVAEGGNLGLTQLARIEYSLNGGRINTDFIDNSGGVDSSDREVNIKILLSDAGKYKGLTRTETQYAARVDDGRSGGTRIAQQLPADAGDQHERSPLRGTHRRNRATDCKPRTYRPTQSFDRVPAGGCGSRGAAGSGNKASRAPNSPYPELCQDRPLQRPHRVRCVLRGFPGSGPAALFSGRAPPPLCRPAADAPAEPADLGHADREQHRQPHGTVASSNAFRSIRMQTS